MAEDVPRDPTETSPLLGDENGHRQSNGAAHGANPESVDGAVPAGEASAEETAVAQKMHLLLPAIGIGVSFLPHHSHARPPTDNTQIFLCAVDQLLTVATYAKIGSELNALNNTSWLATS
jgi:hypothetical protein